MATFCITKQISIAMLLIDAGLLGRTYNLSHSTFLKSFMKKILLALLTIVSMNAFAADNSIAKVSVSTVSVRGTMVLFSVTEGTPANVCNHHGYDFYLDISTVGGKNLYAALLAAKLNNAKVSMVYTESTTPGVVNCPGANMAKPWVIDIL